MAEVAGDRYLKTQLQFPSRMQKVSRMGENLQLLGFGAALGDYLRLQYGKQIGAHDRTQEEVAI